MTDLSKLFGDKKLPLTCPKCGHKSQQSLARLKRKPDPSCPQCGVVLDASQFRSELAKADKILDKFGKSLDKLGKIR